MLLRQRRGIGSQIFVGLDNWTGLGTFSLALPDLPSFTQPTLGSFLWALVVGLLAAVIGTGIRRLALLLRPHVERRGRWWCWWSARGWPTACR